MNDTPKDIINISPLAEGRPWLIADLAFVFVVPWLVLWRLELPDGPGRSMWAGGWPAVVVIILVAAALTAGLTQRRPRGFLPYPARWALLGTVLIFSAWIALSLADAGHHTPDLRTAARELRAEAEADKQAATRAEDRAKSDAVIADTETAAKFADAIQKAAQSGASIPQADLGPGEPRLDPPTQKELEQAAGIADVIEEGGELPPELAAEAAEAGLDDAKMLTALLMLAATLLAPMLGLSTMVTYMLLNALVVSGELSVGGAIKVAYALTSAALPDGGFDEGKLLESFEHAGELARQAQRILQSAEQAGGKSMKDSPVMDVLKRAAKDASAEGFKCLEEVSDKHSAASADELEKLLREYCRDLDPKQRKRAVHKRRGGKR